jgi:peptide/nickel transport system permease protein
VLAAVVGVFLGKIAAWHKGSRLDNVMSISALVCYTLFIPWFALLLLWILGFKWGLFPLGGVLTPALWISNAPLITRVLDVLHHLMLPLLTLFVINLGPQGGLYPDGPGKGIE